LGPYGIVVGPLYGTPSNIKEYDPRPRKNLVVHILLLSLEWSYINFCMQVMGECLFQASCLDESLVIKIKKKHTIFEI